MTKTTIEALRAEISGITRAKVSTIKCAAAGIIDGTLDAKKWAAKIRDEADELEAALATLSQPETQAVATVQPVEGHSDADVLSSIAVCNPPLPPGTKLYTTPPKPAEAESVSPLRDALKAMLSKEMTYGREMWPEVQQARAALEAHPTTPTHDGGEDAAIAAAFREVAKCSYAQDGVAGELFAKVRELAALTPATPQGGKDCE